jgi:hypothetical protein
MKEVDVSDLFVNERLHIDSDGTLSDRSVAIILGNLKIEVDQNSNFAMGRKIVLKIRRRSL